MTIESWICRRRAAAIIIASLFSTPAAATVVEFQTVVGNFRVNLFDTTTPITVENFLGYLSNGAFTDSIIHRSDPGFVIQGGGFAYNGSLSITSITQNAMIRNEPLLSNVRGTIAMAKLNTGENTATNQWFINLDDNSGELDAQNGGFTVFGIVMDDGMTVVDAIAALPVFDFGAPFNALPLQNYSSTDFANGVDLSANSLIIVNAIVVVDAAADTGANLLPPANPTSLINPPPPPLANPDTGSSGSGSLGLVSMIGLIILGIVRRFR